MSKEKLYWTKDKLIAFTLKEWCEVLDSYELEDITDIFYSSFDFELRELLRPYLRYRVISNIIKKLNKGN